KVRSLGLLPTSLATRALAIKFQSVTTSARAGATNSAAATMPGSKIAAANLKTDLIVRLLRVAAHAMEGCFTSRWAWYADRVELRLPGLATIETISLGMSASPRNLYPVERRGKDTASSLRRMHVVLLVRCARRADRSYRGVFIGPRQPPLAYRRGTR